MLQNFFFSQPKSVHSSSPGGGPDGNHFLSRYWQNSLSTVRRRLLLSPEEGAMNVLKAVFSFGTDGKVAVPYYVNGVAAQDRLALRLQERTEEERQAMSGEMQICFEDAVRSLPLTVRKTIVQRLLHCSDIMNELGKAELVKQLASEIDSIPNSR